MKHQKETDLIKFMSKKNSKAIASFEDTTGQKCVDLIQTEDNFYTFKTFRKDPEDPNGWFQYGHEGQLYSTKEEALDEARKVIEWFI
tara:strand:- start:2 stop:262 length:261 start_codon:yes stop_codon:yes gene_type:complete